MLSTTGTAHGLSVHRVRLAESDPMWTTLHHNCEHHLPREVWWRCMPFIADVNRAALHTDAYGDGNGISNADFDIHANENSDRHPDVNRERYKLCDRHADSESNRDLDKHVKPDRDRDAKSDTDVYRHKDSNNDPHGNCYYYSDRDGDSNSN